MVPALAWDKFLAANALWTITWKFKQTFLKDSVKRLNMIQYTAFLSSQRIYEPLHGISNNVVCAASKSSDQPAHTHSLIRAFPSRLNVLWLLRYWLNVIWSFYAEKKAPQAPLSIHLSKYHIVGNHMWRLIYICFSSCSLVVLSKSS